MHHQEKKLKLGILCGSGIVAFAASLFFTPLLAQILAIAIVGGLGGVIVHLNWQELKEFKDRDQDPYGHKPQDTEGEGA